MSSGGHMEEAGWTNRWSQVGKPMKGHLIESTLKGSQ